MQMALLSPPQCCLVWLLRVGRFHSDQALSHDTRDELSPHTEISSWVDACQFLCWYLFGDCLFHFLP
ncbi:rCG44071 [Rattus norvegicus]|uniref:RCG44071 n=1 Tax=Rattus norvegicus TaxID=10116 RepID=A6J6V1_RAT|nr:rCG44071 [Rattus norvegicus]